MAQNTNSPFDIETTIRHHNLPEPYYLVHEMADGTAILITMDINDRETQRTYLSSRDEGIGIAKERLLAVQV